MASWDVGNVNIGYESMYSDDPTQEYVESPPEDTPSTNPPSITSALAGLFIIGAAIATYYFFF